jgi:ferric-dicitrate binding protein FerR (iron transport regulator)
LILANGKTVSISSKQSTVKYSSDGSGIMVNDSSVIADSVSDDRLNQLIVPYGKHSYILLSEGTRVWLNSGSKLVFPSIFKGNTREVYLEGEAFFEVASNDEKPFYVKTDAFKTKVYGTKFDIQAYKLDNAYSIVLVEGKVSMNVNKNSVSQEIFLTPNQKATITKGKEIFEIVNVENTDLYTAWVEGYLTFSNTEVADLLKRVSRYYNITIEMELTDDVEKIYGKLDLKDNCDRVLDGIAFISKTKYEKRGNKYVFMSN